MRLHWFREHKNIVYYLLIPGVVIGLVFFVPTGKTGGSLPGGASPSLLYTVGNRSFELSPTEVLQYRNAYNGANPRGYYDSSASRQQDENNATTLNIGTLLAEIEAAREQGYEVGHEEFKEILRSVVMQKIKTIDRSEGDVKLTPEMYDKMLAQLNLSRNQYESMIHDLVLRDKFRTNVQANVNESDPAQYAKFTKRKENARIRSKTIPSDSMLSKTKDPTEDEIKKVYNMSGSETDYPNKKSYSDIFMTEPTLSVEAFFYKDEKPFADLGKVTEKDLLNYYDLHKIDKWKDTSKKEPGGRGFFAHAAAELQGKYLPFETVKADVEKEWKESELKNYYNLHKKNWPDADLTKKDTYKPFETVKAEVEKLWQEDRVAAAKTAAKNTMMLNVSSMTKKDALLIDETTFKSNPANKDKPFDMDAWAKDHHMVRWVTPEQTEDKYKGGKLELNAPNLSLGEQIFSYLKPQPRMPESLRDMYKSHAEEFTSLAWIDPNKPELGGIIARKLKYVEAREKTLDEAKPKIIERLKILESVKLASEEATRLHDKWAKGEELPNLDELDEFTSEKKPSHPLVSGMKSNPKPIGEVLDVAQGQPELDEKEKEKNKDKPVNSSDAEKKWFYVGTVVERKLPTLDGYVHAPTTDWNRDQERYRASRMDGAAIMFAMLDQIHTNVTKVGTMADPDLRQVFQRGDE